MSNFHFDEGSHTYTLDGRVLPSVTQVLKPLTDPIYRFVSRDVMDDAADLGRAVHKACELIAKNSLDWDSLHPDVTPYVDGYLQWRSESRFEPILIEEPGYHPLLGYAGMLDLFGRQVDRPTLVDLKTTSTITAAVVGPQTAAYADIIAKHPAMAGFGKQKIVRSAVHLIGDGTYRQVFFNDDTDRSVFVSLLNIHNWRVRHNL